MKSRSQLLDLLAEALGWLDDYDLRMQGTTSLCDKIEDALTSEDSNNQQDNE